MFASRLDLLQKKSFDRSNGGELVLSNSFVGESSDGHLEELERSACSYGVSWNTVHKLLLPQTVKQ